LDGPNLATGNLLAEGVGLPYSHLQGGFRKSERLEILEE
jgi:hypothetical protein